MAVTYMIKRSRGKLLRFVNNRVNNILYDVGKTCTVCPRLLILAMKTAKVFLLERFLIIIINDFAAK